MYETYATGTKSLVRRAPDGGMTLPTNGCPPPCARDAGAAQHARNRRAEFLNPTVPQPESLPRCERNRCRGVRNGGRELAYFRREIGM